jgi:Sec7-like guanine-nucleotide exchange factor
MEKLETFFIKIVAAAQEAAQPTSGAVSTTKIGGFLAGELSEEQQRSATLDKLVSASQLEAISAESLETEKPTAEPSKIASAESSAAVKKDILEQLTTNPTPEDNEQAGKGDS